jgi:hypothetical protein
VIAIIIAADAARCAADAQAGDARVSTAPRQAMTTHCVTHSATWPRRCSDRWQMSVNAPVTQPMTGRSGIDASRPARPGVAGLESRRERRAVMTALGSLSVAAVVGPVAPTLGLAPEGGIAFPDLAAALTWGLCGALAASALGLAWLGDYPRTDFRQRLTAAWNRDPSPRVVTSPHGRAGGTHGRVPPRSAAGSPPLPRHAFPGRARRS